MKKLLLLLVSILFISSHTRAQDECMAFFPTTPGTVLVTSNYDADNNLMSTMTYRINDSYDYTSGSNTRMGFIFMDNTNSVCGTGNLTAGCNNGFFSMKMEVADASPYMMDALAQNTELIGNFLDYPNNYDNMSNPFDMSPFDMDGGEYIIKSKDEKSDDIKVRVYDRKYEKNETVTTPAGSFDASKISFSYDVTRNGKTMTYKGTEWFAKNAGIVKTETCDKGGNAICHSQLTTLKKG